MAKASTKKKTRFDIRVGVEHNSPLGEYLQESAAEGNHSDRLKQLAIMGMALVRLKGLNFATAMSSDATPAFRHLSADRPSGTKRHSKNDPNGGVKGEQDKHTAHASETDLDTDLPLDFDPSILKIKMRTD